MIYSCVFHVSSLVCTWLHSCPPALKMKRFQGCLMVLFNLQTYNSIVPCHLDFLPSFCCQVYQYRNQLYRKIWRRSLKSKPLAKSVTMEGVVASYVLGYFWGHYAVAIPFHTQSADVP